MFRYSHISICAWLLLLLHGHHALAQHCDAMLAAAMADGKRIYVTESTDVSRKELRKDLTRVKSELKSDLRTAMAEKVLTEVRSTTTSGVTESGSYTDSYFNSETEITATAALSMGEFEYCVDEKRRIVYGIYSLDPRLTASAKLQDCINRMLRLNAEIGPSASSEALNDPEVYRSIRDRVKRDARVVIYLNPEIDMNYLNEQFVRFETYIQRHRANHGHELFNTQFRNAETKLHDKDFPGAIRALYALKRDYPQRTEVATLLEVSYRRYERHMNQTVETYMAQGDYVSALTSVDTYCDVKECNEREYRLRDEVRKAFFDDSYVRFDRALKVPSKPEATTHLQELKMLASVDAKRYKQADERYTQFLIGEEMRGVQQELARDNFLVAHLKVKGIEGRYGASSADLLALKKTTEQKLLQSEVRKERHSRPMLFSFVAGLEVVTNQVEDALNLQDQLRTFTMAYSAGLYKKFNYGPRYARANYPRLSDQIGIKVRLADHVNTWMIAPNDVSQIEPAGRYSAELLLDGYLFRAIHFSGGAVFPNLEYDGKMIYTAEVGLRIPMGPVSLQANVRALYLNSKPDMMLTGGIFYQIDFWRAFGAKDRKQVKYNLGL